MSWDEEMRSKKGKKRGATNVARSLDGLGQAKGTSGGADYAEADFSFVAGIIIETTRRGGAVSLGLSRDKGAYNVTIFMDGDRRTVWINGDADLNAELEKILHFMASLPLD
jgi:hypothetical protein